MLFILFSIIAIEVQSDSSNFCNYQRDGRYCDGGTVRHCIAKREVLEYKCISGCVSGSCVGASFECYNTNQQSICKGNHKIRCTSTKHIIGYKYCANGCIDGKCIGKPFTGCNGKSRECECINNDNGSTSVMCCYPNVLMLKIDCQENGCNTNTTTCNTNSASSVSSTSSASSVSSASSETSIHYKLLFFVFALGLMLMFG